jgi:hypothetical protein
MHREWESWNGPVSDESIVFVVCRYLFGGCNTILRLVLGWVRVMHRGCAHSVPWIDQKGISSNMTMYLYLAILDNAWFLHWKPSAAGDTARTLRLAFHTRDSGDCKA